MLNWLNCSFLLMFFEIPFFPFVFLRSRAPVTSALTLMLMSPKWLKRTQCSVLVSAGMALARGTAAPAVTQERGSGSEFKAAFGTEELAYSGKSTYV